MRVDVAGPQVPQDEIFERALGAEIAEVHHHRHRPEPSGLDGAIDRVPLRPAIVRRLHADDEAGELADAHRRQARVHVGKVLFDRSALHARPDDVDEREDARPRPVDDLDLELPEVPPAGAAGVDDGRHAGADGVRIGLHGDIAAAQVRIGHRPEEHVRVQIDQARCHVQPGGIDDSLRARRVDGRATPPRSCRRRRRRPTPCRALLSDR